MWTEVFTKNIDLIFFIYGLAFVAMGIAIFIQPRSKGSIFRIGDIIWLLGAFGLSHGINEWLDMFHIVKGYSGDAWDAAQLVVLVVSYLFLFEFGRRLLGLSFHKLIGKWVTVGISFLILVLVGISKEGLKILPRYLLGFPGGLFSAAGLFIYYRRNSSILEPLGIRKYILTAAVAMGIYGILGGLVTPKAGFFPASVINNSSFLNIVGIPVQVFRVLCAILLAWSIYHILNIFNWEISEQLQHTAAAKAAEMTERKKAEEIAGLYNALQKSHAELKAMQSQLIHAEKMRVVGSLASGVAHEVKNPLAIIMQGIEYLSEKVGKDNQNIAMVLNNIDGAVNRADEIVKGLLDFSSLSELNIQEENLNSVIEKALDLIKYQCEKHHIQVERDLKDNLAHTRIDRNRIEQVFLNIFLNAIQAMPAGGKLTVRTSFETVTSLGDGIGRRKDDILHPGNKVVIAEVEDTGKGIPEEVMEKIFDPFFTTRRQHGGTGLGLAIVKNIIESHKARIEIQDKKEGGVKVILMFKAE